MTTLFKDLTLEQQEHLVSVFNEVEYLPEDATHIDFEEAHHIGVNSVLKINPNQFFFDSFGKWCSAEAWDAISYKYYPIPDDFNRQTGEIMSMDKPLPTQPNFPDFDFKLSCGDRPEVRQWLKDNGCKWLGNIDLIGGILAGTLHLCVRGKTVSWSSEEVHETINLPEIQPTFTVTGFTVPESEKKRKETLDKIKEKEDTIKRLTDEINQLKQEN